MIASFIITEIVPCLRQIMFIAVNYLKSKAATGELHTCCISHSPYLDQHMRFWLSGEDPGVLDRGFKFTKGV